VDLGAAHQRAMHGTAVSDLQQPGPLRVVEIPAEGEDLADAIEVGRGVLLAPVAVVPLHPPVGEVDADRKGWDLRSVTVDLTQPAPDGATHFVPVSPARLFDTRTGGGLATAGKIGAGDTLDVQVAGRLGIPADAAAVVVNLTVTAPEGPGFVTAFPRGGAVPNASTLNVTAAGQTRPNLAIVPLEILQEHAVDVPADPGALS